MTAARRGAVIVGAGLMGRWHAHALQALGEPVVAVVDTDMARAEALARSHGARPMHDVNEALKLAPLAVHVCTPLASHVAHATAALDAGAHVLIEKPFAPSADETTRLLDRARAARLVAAPVHQYLFQQGMRETFDAVTRFGPVVHADFVACSAGADEQPELRSAVARDILPHSLSILRRLLGASFTSAGWTGVEPAAGELRVNASCGRMTANILISMSGRPTRNTARLIGERGTAHVDFFHGFATFESPDVSRARKIARPFDLASRTMVSAGVNLVRRAIGGEAAYPGLRELIAEFYAAVRGAAPSPIDDQETMDVSSAMERVATLT